MCGSTWLSCPTGRASSGRLSAASITPRGRAFSTFWRAATAANNGSVGFLMLFRIAFYLCQLGLLGSAVALVGLCLSFVAQDVAVWLWGPGLGLAVVSWLAWSLLTGVQNTGGRLWCPLCGTRCPMEPESLFGLRPTLGC